MRIWHSRYRLHATHAFNSRADVKVREGALLRVVFPDGVGFADLCPFPGMGDQPLDIEFRHLAADKPSALAARSMHFARLDATARAQGVSLYDPVARIENHFLVTNLARFDADRVSSIAASGYRRCKIKIGRDLVVESRRLETFVDRLAQAGRSMTDEKLRVRLDFNAALSCDRFARWLDANLTHLLPVLEFIEDPFPYDARQWSDIGSQWPVSLALDMAADPLATGGEGAAVIVVKPAVQEVASIMKMYTGTDKRFVFTHYMDSPVGQMCALVATQQVWHEARAQILVCGLQHHDVSQACELQRAVESDGPFIVPPQGRGLGFDDLLERQAWTELVV
jgi:o-succinylbenzoate synthase